MFCGLLGGKFSKKCKQAVKLTKMRIEQIKKQKQAVVHFDKKDVAGLVAGRREADAFKRMDALVLEMNLVSCYEMIEKFCDCIVNQLQLPTLQKTKECPEEAMEAVSTLIFAAARFHDLPELRDLRSLFAKRYGNCMESSVNSEFAEKTRNKASSMEKKLELMKNIADEFDLPKEIVLPQHESNDVVQKHQGELEPKDIHVISTDKTRDSFDPDVEAHRGRKFEEKCELPQSMAEDQYELDCIPVEKGVVSVEILNAKPVNGRATPYIKADANDRTRGKVEDQLNNNTRGRYLNPPYLIHPKINDTTNEVGVSQIEKPMPLSVRRKSEEPIIDTKDDAVGINKPAKAEVTPQRAFSLPSESVSTAEAKKTHVRGKSLQPDPSLNRGRVHPRLPDYDQLVANFSALKNG